MADFPDAGGNILLSGSRIYLTPNEQDAYRVLQGKILIFLVPLADETPGRRSLLREAAAGEMLPSFRYVDADGQEWCYLFTAPEKAELAVLPGFATNPLRKRFLTSCGMEHITQEGYHNALVDRYRTNLVQEDAADGGAQEDADGVGHGEPRLTLHPVPGLHEIVDEVDHRHSV